MLDTNASCRTCMKSDVHLLHLYEPVNIDENSNIQLAQLLLDCAAIHVSRSVYYSSGEIQELRYVHLKNL